MAEEAIRATATGYNDSLKNLVALYKGYSDFENSGFYTGLNDIQIMQKKKWDNAEEKWLTELPYRPGTRVREYMPYQYIETGIQDKLYLRIGMILGKLTGFTKEDFIATYYEVRLFNPYWDFSGEPNYYIFVRKEALDLKVDNGTVKGVVWRDYTPREKTRMVGGDYPHVDITYKTVCWDKDFTSLGHWNRTDTYFGNMDWLKAVTGVDGTVGEYGGPVYYGDNYDYKAGRKFTGIFYEPLSGDNNTFKPGVAATGNDNITMKSATALWDGQPIKRCGYICKEDLLPTLDINTVGAKIINNWDRTFLLPHTISELTEGTTYTIIPFAEKMDGTFYYGELITALTDSATSTDVTLFTTMANSSTDGTQIILTTEVYESYTGINSYGVQELLRKAYTGTVVRCGHIVGLTKETAVEYEAQNIWSQWDSSSYGVLDGTKIRQFNCIINTTPLTKYYIAAFVEMDNGSRFVREGIGEQENATLTTTTMPNYADKGELSIRVGYVDATSAILYATIVKQPASPIPNFLDFTILYSDYNQHLVENFKYGPALDPTKIGIEQKIELKNLNPGRRYYAQSYGRIMVNVMSGRSNTVSFETIGTDIKNTISDITNNSFKVKTNLISIPFSVTVVERGVCWALTKGILLPAASGISTSFVGSPFGEFTTTVPNLKESASYFVKSFIRVTSTEFSNSRYYYSEEKEVRTLASENTESVLRTYTLPVNNTTPTATQAVIAIENPQSVVISRSGVAWRYSTNVGTMTALTDFNGIVEGGELQPITLEGFSPNDSIVIKSFVETTDGDLLLSDNEETVIFPKPDPDKPPLNPDIPINPDDPDTPPVVPKPEIDITILPKPTPERLVFPKKPVIGQKYYFKTKTWIWDGECWLNITSSNTSSNISAVGGTTLEGTDYVFIPANGTPEENFKHLRETYKSLGTDKKTIMLLAPGQYGFGTPDQLTEDSPDNSFLLTNPIVSLISLTGKADVEFLNLKTNFDTGLDVYPEKHIEIRGIKFIYSNSELDSEVFTVNTIPSFALIENCETDDNISEAFKNNKGRIVNCISKAIYSFGGDHAATTEFIGCEGGDNSFNGSLVTKGLFRNCKAGINSFGMNGIADAEFYYCESSDSSFGDGSMPMTNSKFIGCRAGAACFTAVNMESCYFENCFAESGFDGPVITSCRFVHCGTEGSFSSAGATVTDTKYILCYSEMSLGYFSSGTNMGFVGQYTP